MKKVVSFLRVARFEVLACVLCERKISTLFGSYQFKPDGFVVISYTIESLEYSDMKYMDAVRLAERLEGSCAYLEYTDCFEYEDGTEEENEKVWEIL